MGKDKPELRRYYALVTFDLDGDDEPKRAKFYAQLEKKGWEREPSETTAFTRSVDAPSARGARALAEASFQQAAKNESVGFTAIMQVGRTVPENFYDL